MCMLSDVLNYIKAKNLKPVTKSVDLPAAAKPTPPPAPSVSVVKPVAAAAAPSTAADFTDIEVTNMRSVIASRLTMSKVHPYATFCFCFVLAVLNLNIWK